jgi:hypothetical protein
MWTCWQRSPRPRSRSRTAPHWQRQPDGAALPEQIAVLDALAAVGGPEAARSVARTLSRGWVQGPTLTTAVATAAQLGSHLRTDTVLALLRHADPAIRADACRLTRSGPEVTTLAELLDDLHRDVCIGAACALGRMGRPEAAPLLKQALRRAASQLVIKAIPPIADEECVVLLGRIARASPPDIAAAAEDALEAVEHPLAARLLECLRE